ncbi:2Fe-2S iron-sulfur cluster binding domain-containing protein [Acidobacteria bacterium ACD]|nr:MAG: 2Fe-2S ferredoxin [Acidobacteriota bacterium]MDL1951462.1 2Fe-2S iron-sulfur cluster binding domain-containing protein [Acidobacteria bacterium ACD]
MPRVVFLNEGKRAEVAAGRTVLDVAMELSVALSHVCGGGGTCSTCRVECAVNPQNLSPVEPNELAYDMGPNVRLGCQARILGDVGLRVVKLPKAIP